MEPVVHLSDLALVEFGAPRPDDSVRRQSDEAVGAVPRLRRCGASGRR